MTGREKEIFALIEDNPMISQEQIAEKLGISRSAVSVFISNLLKQGALKGRGYIVNKQDYVITIGSAGMDIVGVLTEKAMDSVYKSINHELGDVYVGFGGAARNIAEALARLGTDVRLIAPLSGDMFGRQIAADCEELGINIDCCLRLYDRQQSMMIQLRNKRERFYYGMSDYRADMDLSPEFFESKRDVIANARQIVVTDNIAGESMEYILAAHGKKEVWCILSGVRSRIDKVQPLVHRYTTLYMNMESATALTGAPEGTGVKDVLARLGKMGAREAFVSCSNKCIIHFKEGRHTEFPLKMDIISDNEIGKDAFVSGLVHCRLKGVEGEEAIRYAEACSSLTQKNGYHTVRHVGHDAVLNVLRQ